MSVIDFVGLAAFAEFAAGLVVEIDHVKHKALEKAATIVEDEAKRAIGTYDYGWPALSPYTIQKKGADTPLLETGEMRDSIGHYVSQSTIGGGPVTAYVGTDNQKAVWQELGTSRIPPRSFLVGAATHKEKQVVDEIGDSFSTLLLK